MAKLSSLGADRLADMDAGGIDMQILSHTAPGVETLEGDAAVSLAQSTNDLAATAVSMHPTRFGAFATLPMTDPPAAARELERTVTQLGFKGALINGTTQGRFLDDPDFYPILQRAEELNVPLYLHPAPPPAGVSSIYFAGLDPALAAMLSTAGWGWHAELGLHVLRLITTGVFDRLPHLQVIIGHMGEMLPYMLVRSARILSRAVNNLELPIAGYFHRNIHITTSGLFTRPPLQLLLEVIGIDRIMFSIDYPYSSTEQGRAFLDKLALEPDDMEKFTHVNAEKLLRLPA